MEYIALALAPGIAICLYFFYTDIYNKEPRLNLFVSFFWGCVSIIPAVLVERSLLTIIDGSLVRVAIFAYLVVGLSEELGKFLGLRWYAYTRKSFDEPLDGIIYSVMVSMGFATVENLFYVDGFAQSGRGLEVGLQRMFLSVPAHASFAVVMGYFVGKAKFNPGRSLLLLLMGLLTATFFHGTYDFFLFIKTYSFAGREFSEVLLATGAIASYVVCLVLSRKLLREQKNLSKQMYPDKNATPTV